MLPTNQGLESADFVGVQRHNGLKVESKFLALDGQSEVRLQLQARYCIVAHGRIEYLVTRFSKRLGGIHCPIGLPEQLFGRLVSCSSDRDSNASSAEHRMP